MLRLVRDAFASILLICIILLYIFIMIDRLGMIRENEIGTLSEEELSEINRRYVNMLANIKRFVNQSCIIYYYRIA